MRYTALLGIGLMLVSCTNQTDDDTSANHMDPSMIHNFDHPNFQLTLIADSNDYPGLEISWNETFGRMEINDDKGLSLFITQDTTTCKVKKEEIEGGIFQIDYLVDTDSVLAYKSSLPDGSEAYHHLFVSLTIGDLIYAVESDPLVSYDQSQQNSMLSLINTLQANTILQNN